MLLRPRAQHRIRARRGVVHKSQALRHGAEGTMVVEADAGVKRPEAAQRVAEGVLGGGRGFVS